MPGTRYLNATINVLSSQALYSLLPFSMSFVLVFEFRPVPSKETFLGSTVYY